MNTPATAFMLIGRGFAVCKPTAVETAVVPRLPLTASKFRRRPKSSSLICRSSVRPMLAGLTSRCT